MQRKIWDVANADSVGLQRYYDANKDKYWWEASAEAVIFTANSEAAAEEAKKEAGSQSRNLEIHCRKQQWQSAGRFRKV